MERARAGCEHLHGHGHGHDNRLCWQEEKGSDGTGNSARVRHDDKRNTTIETNLASIPASPASSSRRGRIHRGLVRVSRASLPYPHHCGYLWSSERPCRLLPRLAPGSVDGYAATGPCPSEPVARRHGCTGGAGEDYIVRVGSLEKERQAETTAGINHATTSHTIFLVSLPPCASNKVNTKNPFNSYTSHVIPRVSNCQANIYLILCG